LTGRQAQAADRSDPLVKVDVQTILRGAAEACLVHQGVKYRLRVTKEGKLLLTK
jgi:hemin uptake protein HemP